MNLFEAYPEYAVEDHHIYENPVLLNRRFWQKEFATVLYDIDCDWCYYAVENEKFKITPFQWDCNCEENKHDQGCLLMEPNFIYKPLQFQISWYTHPFRGANANKEISPKEFKMMLEDVKSFFQKREGIC